MSKNVSKFSSSENLSFLAACDAQTSSAPSPTLSAGNGDTISARPAFNTTQQICEYAGDMVMPASAISSYGEAFHVPDIIESTVGLLSSAEVTCHQPPLVDSCEDIVENVPIRNEGNVGDKQALMAINSRSMKQHHQTEKVEGESSHPSRIATSEPNNATKNHEGEPWSHCLWCIAFWYYDCCMASERILMDVNPGNKLHCAAKAAADKEKTVPWIALFKVDE
ncbi:uncharacterized protein LOC120168925 [Hibiscus syriacus]|uniref:uncharacterized protein LOC120168925 n=1 Tax=Hibiscus syriacus TaxID=106335 RepID=UPI001920EB54|nr:uncharacterized protein LOC120168925 [Hibiscus syriacus]